MKNSGKKITIVLTVLASVLIAYAVMNQNSDNEEYVESENLKTVAVNIGTAQEMTYKKVQHLTGTVEGLTSAIISSRYSEKVSEIFVENGQKVVKGQALLRTDDTELSNNLMIARNALRKAQVNYDNASATYRRNKLIFDKGAVSSQYLETLAALPLAFIGALLGLILCHSNFSMISGIGILLLMGLVTKNAILLIDFAKKRIEEGEDCYEALVDAGKSRFRPIMMTTFAMMFAMLPIAVGLGDGGEARDNMKRPPRMNVKTWIYRVNCRCL